LNEQDWPTTAFIERSYKETLVENGLPPVTAIDGLFSVMQYHIGLEFSWAEAMNIGNKLMYLSGGIPNNNEWENERIVFNSDVFINDIAFDEAIQQFEANLFSLPPDLIKNLQFASVFVEHLGLFIEPLTTLGPDITNFAKIGQAILMLALFRKFGGDTTVSDVNSMLKAVAGADEESRTNSLAIIKLSTALGLEVSPITNNSQLKDAMGQLRGYLKDHSGLSLMNLTDDSFASLTDLASKNTPEAMAYRYALKELNPFAVIGVDYSSKTDLTDLSQTWIEDRAQMLVRLLAENSAFINLPFSGDNTHYTDLGANIILKDNLVPGVDIAVLL
jgi:hypothetical protein